jgi:hypothetical protein
MKNLIWMLFSAVLAVGAYQAGQSSAPKAQIVLSIPSDDADPQKAYDTPVPALDPTQQRLLEIAYKTAKSDGLPYPQLLQGILLQETRAGRMPIYKVAGPAGHHYYGVCQIKMDAARDVLIRYPELWAAYGFHTHTDEEVIAKLIENDQFNIAVASKYLTILRSSGYSSPRALAVAYNRGPGGAVGVNVATDPYSRGVSRHIHAMGGDRATYHVEPGDSLSLIAMTLKLDADELFAANPKAFIGGNKDLLMAGVDIVLPRAAT